MNMVEKIAYAMAENNNDLDIWQGYIEDAISVLTVLSVPTDKMLDAAFRNYAMAENKDRAMIYGHVCADYVAMIQAALEEPQ